MKIIFFGLGSIGQRHAGLLVKKGGHELFAFRTHQADAPAPDFAVKVLSSWTEIEAVKPQAAFITNPTAIHISTAIECAKRGMALFLEKPLGSSTEGLDELLALIEKKKLASYVAYVLRFHPLILYLKEALDKEPCVHMRAEAAAFLPAWRPGRDHHKSYSSKRSLGGGVVFDLSHEMDYVDFLLGGIEKIEGQCARRSDVTEDCEDSADMHVQGARGFASVHLSYLSHLNQRRIMLYFPDRTVVADLNENSLRVYKQNALTDSRSWNVDRDVVFGQQLDFFLANIQNPSMMNSVPQAAGLFRKICGFKESCHVV